MRRITLWALSTVATLVLLFSYRTSTSGPGTTQPTAQTVPGTGQGADPPAATSAPDTNPGAGDSSQQGATATAEPKSGGGSGTYQGSVVQTRWGPIQVTVKVSGGKVTAVDVPIYPNGNHRDEEINAYALPILQQEAVQQQSADIDSVSGATVTSDGYRESLQAALDAAHL